MTNDNWNHMWKERGIVNELVQTEFTNWLNYELTTIQWWLLVVFLIVPWIIWVNVSDKRRIVEILLLGAFVAIVTTHLDLIGYFLNFWDYPVQLIPLLPGALPFDLSIVPVAFMLVYQYFRTWKTYGMALVGMAVVYAFIGEPISNWLHLVLYLKWTYIYSFVYYIVIGVTAKAFVDKLIDIRTTW